MKKLEKYKIAPQAKFGKFKVKHFVEIPTNRHDKAVMLSMQNIFCSMSTHGVSGYSIFLTEIPVLFCMQYSLEI